MGFVAWMYEDIELGGWMEPGGPGSEESHMGKETVRRLVSCLKDMAELHQGAENKTGR